MTQKQVMRLARAFAPDEVKQQLDQIEKLKRERAMVTSHINMVTRDVMETVQSAEVHHAIPSPGKRPHLLPQFEAVETVTP